MRLVADGNQDLLVVRRGAPSFPDSHSCALEPGSSKLQILLLLAQLLNSVAIKAEERRRSEMRVRRAA